MSPGRGRLVTTAEAVVTAVRAAGTSDVVTLRVPDPEPWEGCRPGQLLVVPADPGRGSVLPEVHWLAGVHGDPVHGTTVELVVPAARETGPEETWTLLGPLGRGFAPPSRPVPVLLVAHEGGAVPLRWLVEVLRQRGCPVHVLLSASDSEAHLDLVHLRRHARTVVLTLPDDLPLALPRMLDDPAVDPAAVYAAAPVSVLRVVAEAALGRGRATRVAALDLAAPVVCGTGLCGACDLEVREGRGVRMVRPCVEGPVLPGEWLLQEAAR